MLGNHSDKPRAGTSPDVRAAAADIDSLQLDESARVSTGRI